MSDNLPKDVMQAILVRLSAKELVKCCRLVCKSWDSLIKSPDFISAHLQLQLQLQRAIAIEKEEEDPLLIRLSKPRFKWRCSPAEEEKHYTLYFANRVAAHNDQAYWTANRHRRQVTQPQRTSRQFQARFPCTTKTARIVGYCNGLLCFSPSSSSSKSFVVWNPSLQKFFTIPPPNSHTTTTTTFTGVGFGFDSTTNDFKLLVGFDLYSLRSNSWKTIPTATATAPADFRVSDDASDVFVKGALHFLGNDVTDGKAKKLILGFDVGDQTFRQIMLPKGLESADDRSLLIGKFGECIALSASVGRYYHVWVMKEYGNEPSWTKILDMADDLKWPPRMLGVWNNGGEILMERCGQVLPTDLKTGVADYGGWTMRMYASVDTFVDTLVLLDIGKDTTHYIDSDSDSDDASTEDNASS